MEEEKKREKVYRVYLSQAYQIMIFKEDFSYLIFVVLLPYAEHKARVDVRNAYMTDSWYERMNSRLGLYVDLQGG